MRVSASLPTASTPSPGTLQKSKATEDSPKFFRAADPTAHGETPKGTGTHAAARNKVDGFHAPYRAVTGGSAEETAMAQQQLNAAAGGMVAAVAGNQAPGQGVYREFQHNGQPAIAMRPGGSDEVRVSFGNSNGPSSLWGRLVHPRTPFQLAINSSTNAVRQLGGPQNLSPREMTAALEGVRLSFQSQQPQQVAQPLYGGMNPPAYGTPSPLSIASPPPYAPR